MGEAEYMVVNREKSDIRQRSIDGQWRAARAITTWRWLADIRTWGQKCVAGLVEFNAKEMLFGGVS